MIPLPKDDAPEEEKVAARKAILGKIGMLPPDSPDGYEVTMPEGIQADEGRIGFFRPYFHQLGLTKEQVQGIAVADAAFQQAVVRQIQDDVILKRDALTREWGPLFKRNEALAAAGLEHYFGKEGMQVLVDTGLINHPEVIRAGYRIGWTLPEDKLVVGQYAGGETLEGIQTKIDAIQFDKENPDYKAIQTADPNNPARKLALDKLTGLILAKGSLEKEIEARKKR
jgi:hypothetical protein